MTPAYYARCKVLLVSQTDFFDIVNSVLDKYMYV